MRGAYKRAGVDIDAGNRFVEEIKPLIKKTRRRGVISDTGGFAGLFALDNAEVKEPVLVAGTDGVGTKLKLAIETGKLDTVGIDLVAMCVNDLACSGARPLFFLDYLATSKIEPERHAAIIAGMARACQETGCALIGGETAEMPDLYASGEFDLAGFAVGIVDRKKIIDGSEVAQQEAIVGLASTGFHSNGYSLIRQIIHERDLKLDQTYEGLGQPLGELLLEPTALYSPLIVSLTKNFHIKAIAHITGGGFPDNVCRVIPKGVQAVISKGSWPIPPAFTFFRHNGDVDESEMFRVFNCGIGMVIIVPSGEATDLIHACAARGKRAWRIGTTRLRPSNSPAVIIE